MESLQKNISWHLLYFEIYNRSTPMPPHTENTKEDTPASKRSLSLKINQKGNIM